MNSQQTQRPDSLVVIGCGYLGQRVMSLAASSYAHTVGIVRSQRRAAELASVKGRVEVADVFSSSCEFAKLTNANPFHAVLMVPPSAIDDPHRAITKLSHDLDAANCKLGLLISSTGVYGDVGNSVVTAETSIKPDDTRSQKLALIERLWCENGSHFRVLRLAGIYGPDRIIGKKTLLSGEPVAGDKQAWLNLIHVEDAADLTLQCFSERAATIELGADGIPAKREEYYRYVADIVGAAAPVFSGPATRNKRGKYCVPDTTFARLNWHPKYGNYRDGVRASLSISNE